MAHYSGCCECVAAAVQRQRKGCLSITSLKGASLHLFRFLAIPTSSTSSHVCSMAHSSSPRSVPQCACLPSMHVCSRRSLVPLLSSALLAGPGRPSLHTAALQTAVSDHSRFACVPPTARCPPRPHDQSSTCPSSHHSSSLSLTTVVHPSSHAPQPSSSHLISSPCIALHCRSQEPALESWSAMARTWDELSETVSERREKWWWRISLWLVCWLCVASTQCPCDLLVPLSGTLPCCSSLWP